AKKSGIEDIEDFLINLPNIGEQSIETITENAIRMNSNCPNPRTKFIFERLIYHLHTFAKEVNLKTDEWKAGIDFITKSGQMCSDVRQENILLSDVLGLSALVDGLSNAKPKGCTECSILGPFHTEDSEEVNASSLCSIPEDNNLTITGKIKDINGTPISGAKIDIWETDKDGLYDVQKIDRSGPDCRGIIFSDNEGNYKVKGLVPVAYSVPSDGPVGNLMKVLQRHSFRPAHIHFKIEAKGYQTLVTALYIEGDPFIKSDAVFGVKNSLVVKLEKNGDLSGNKSSNTENLWKLSFDFVLAENNAH
ncbi:Intradiol ring-cleavage dioxygenase, partial [Phakopsora pachyrhizi]